MQSLRRDCPCRPNISNDWSRPHFVTIGLCAQVMMSCARRRQKTTSQLRERGAADLFFGLQKTFDHLRSHLPSSSQSFLQPGPAGRENTIAFAVETSSTRVCLS